MPTRLERAKDYVLSHPDQSKQEQAEATGLSMSTIALARKALIADGQLQPSRKDFSGPSGSAPTSPLDEAGAAVAPATAPRRPAGPSMLDHEAMVAMTQALDELDGLDDEEIRRRMHKMCVRFMFDARLHPDTRMSASTMWEKLKEKAKKSDLGPGLPLNFDDAKVRAVDMIRACPDVFIAAFKEVFDVVEDADAPQSAEAVVDPVAPPAPAEPAGPADDATPREGSPG